MKYNWKTVLKAFVPPVFLSGVETLFRSAQIVPREAAERGPDWYNRTFALSSNHRKHYCESEHYFLWSIIAHIITRAGVSSVLDIGCGSGQLALLLKDRGLKNYCGIDFSRKRIEFARQLCPGFTFVVADAFETSLLETFDYDACVCSEFLEHVEQDIDVVARIKPGTLFFATVPNFPYASHTRYFKDTTEVHDRYERFFREFSVDSFLGDTKGKRYFLMEGKKLQDHSTAATECQ